MHRSNLKHTGIKNKIIECHTVFVFQPLILITRQFLAPSSPPSLCACEDSLTHNESLCVRELLEEFPKVFIALLVRWAQHLQ